MTCCSPSWKKWLTFTISLLALTLGILMAIFWEALYKKILHQELSLKDRYTQEFKMWKETPIPMYIEFYLYNFTNAAEVENDWTIKPNFVELGPYTYLEKHIREEIKFNCNETITYKTRRLWTYLPEKSNGLLSDKITTINVILATVGYVVRNKHKIVQMGVNFFLEEKRVPFTVTKTVNEFLFEGYDDPMLKLVHKLNITGLDVPFDKFGWFYSRNGSVDYDGTFTMYTGEDDLNKLGRFTLWNGSNHTKIFRDECGIVNGTSGELWYPVKNDEYVSIFSPDICSTLMLDRNGTFTKYGIESHTFVGDARIFDNGTSHPEMDCFNLGVSAPNGVRNISQCKFGAPAFVSFPHFYLADESYRNAVTGMRPNKTLHEFSMSIEPETGIPLKVHATMQINILLSKVPGIKLLKNVSPIYIPMMWFRQSAELSTGLAYQAKMLLVLPAAGNYTGYGIIGIGCLLMFICIFVTVKNGWKNDEKHLLTQQKC